jgi:DNA gyrase/topoisomerase IV subunit B
MQSVSSAVIRTLVLYSLAEVQLGHARSIRVVASGHSFSVEDDGRGHNIARTIEGSPYLRFIYTHLDYPFGETESKPVQLQGLGMSLLNSLCAELSVLVHKPNARLRLAFHGGKLVHHEYREVSGQSGNEISGVLNCSVEATPFDVQSLRDWLSTIAAATPSLSLHFNGQLLQAS